MSGRKPRSGKRNDRGEKARWLGSGAFRTSSAVGEVRTLSQRAPAGAGRVVSQLPPPRARCTFVTVEIASAPPRPGPPRPAVPADAAPTAPAGLWRAVVWRCALVPL